jgi:NADH:ubiquinone oxidoreductase subunit 4 (subunit M)
MDDVSAPAFVSKSTALKTFADVVRSVLAPRALSHKNEKALLAFIAVCAVGFVTAPLLAISKPAPVAAKAPNFSNSVKAPVLFNEVKTVPRVTVTAPQKKHALISLQLRNSVARIAKRADAINDKVGRQ